MAQYIAQIRGQRGVASRLGSKTSGIDAKVNGWHVGARVTIEHEDGRDVVRVYATRGSSPKGGAVLIAEFSTFEEMTRVKAVPA